MTAGECKVKGTVVPTLRYRDVPTAIDWLCTAFGFAKHLVVSDADGTVRYAQLTFGDGMIMLSAADEEDVDRLMAQPDETGGRETQICYLFIEDARAHCARAREAGAMIVLDIDDESSDGRAYSCRDPEGHVWNFGTYDPRRKAAAQTAPPKPKRSKIQRTARFVALGTGMVANAVTSIAFIAWVCAATQPAISAAFAAVSEARPEPGAIPAAALERTVRETRDQLVREAAARETAERGAREVRDQLAREKSAKDAAERAAAEARDALARERSSARPAADDKDARAALRNAEQAAEDARKRQQEADGAAQNARDEATRERTSREAAERAATEARDQLAKEKTLRETAERTAKEARERAKEAAAKAPSKRPPPAKKAVSSGGPLFQ